MLLFFTNVKPKLFIKALIVEMPCLYSVEFFFSKAWQTITAKQWLPRIFCLDCIYELFIIYFRLLCSLKGMVSWYGPLKQLISTSSHVPLLTNDKIPMSQKVDLKLYVNCLFCHCYHLLAEIGLPQPIFLVDSHIFVLSYVTSQTVITGCLSYFACRLDILILNKRLGADVLDFLFSPD